MIFQQHTKYKLTDSESDFYDKNDMEEKLNDLVRWHKAMRKKIENSILYRTNPNSYLGT